MGGGSPGPHPGGKLRGLAWEGLQAHTQGEVEGSGWWGVQGPHPGGKLRGLAREGLQPHSQGVSRSTPWGVSRPTPRGVSRPTPGGSPGPHGDTLRQTPPPPSRQLLLRAVCILLECILICYILFIIRKNSHNRVVQISRNIIFFMRHNT